MSALERPSQPTPRLAIAAAAAARARPEGGV